MFPHIPEADLKDAFQDNFFDIGSTIEEFWKKQQVKVMMHSEEMNLACMS
jgi:hypothetical protein